MKAAGDWLNSFFAENSEFFYFLLGQCVTNDEFSQRDGGIMCDFMNFRPPAVAQQTVGPASLFVLPCWS